jgi:ElaB/YqjD/DUF883 family membrane-anchored ribosome-binding protein
MPLLDSLNDGHEPGNTDEKMLTVWAAAERDAQVQANAHRLLLGRELGARLDAMAHGDKGPELVRWMSLMDASRSKLFDRVSVAREVWSLLAEHPDVAAGMDASLLNRPWSEVRGAVREAVGLKSVGGGGSSGGIGGLWDSWLDKMFDQADVSVEGLEELWEKLTAFLERVRVRLDEEQMEDAASEERAEDDALLEEAPSRDDVAVETVVGVSADGDDPAGARSSREAVNMERRTERALQPDGGGRRRKRKEDREASLEQGEPAEEEDEERSGDERRGGGERKKTRAGGGPER